MEKTRQALLESEIVWTLSAVLIVMTAFGLGLNLIREIFLLGVPSLFHRFIQVVFEWLKVSLILSLIVSNRYLLVSKLVELIHEIMDELNRLIIEVLPKVEPVIKDSAMKILRFGIHNVLNKLADDLLIAPKKLTTSLLPEECVADLEALYQHLKARYQNRWILVLIVLRAVVESLWAFYIQIKIENLWLPRIEKKKGERVTF